MNLIHCHSYIHLQLDMNHHHNFLFYSLLKILCNYHLRLHYLQVLQCWPKLNLIFQYPAVKNKQYDQLSL